MFSLIRLVQRFHLFCKITTVNYFNYLKVAVWYQPKAGVDTLLREDGIQLEVSKSIIFMLRTNME